MDLEANTKATNKADQTEADAERTCIWKVAFVIWLSTIFFLSIVSLPLIVSYSDDEALLDLRVSIILAVILLEPYFFFVVLPTTCDHVVVINVFAFCFTALDLGLCIYLLSKILPWNPLPAVILMVTSWSIPSVVLAYRWYNSGHDLHKIMHKAVNVSTDRLLQWSSNCEALFTFYVSMASAYYVSARHQDKQIHEATEENQRSERFEGPASAKHELAWPWCSNGIKVAIACFMPIVFLLSSVVALPARSIPKYSSMYDTLICIFWRCYALTLGVSLIWRWWQAKVIHKRKANNIFKLACIYTLFDFVLSCIYSIVIYKLSLWYTISMAITCLYSC